MLASLTACDQGHEGSLDCSCAWGGAWQMPMERCTLSLQVKTSYRSDIGFELHDLASSDSSAVAWTLGVASWAKVRGLRGLKCH
jgi:hypothetical protein